MMLEERAAARVGGAEEAGSSISAVCLMPMSAAEVPPAEGADGARAEEESLGQLGLCAGTFGVRTFGVTASRFN